MDEAEDRGLFMYLGSLGGYPGTVLTAASESLLIILTNSSWGSGGDIMAAALRK